MESSTRPKQGPSRGKSFIGAILIACAIALVLIVYVRQADRRLSTAVSQPASSQNAGSNSSKLAKQPSVQLQQQSSSQRQTGPLETGSGGAPAESPQGETPPGMQSAPSGSAVKEPRPDESHH